MKVLIVEDEAKTGDYLLKGLTENGFVVESRELENAALGKFFTDLREDTDQLRVTVLTTLQCNFACDYCFQGDHGDYNKFAKKMSLETARDVVGWIEKRLDEIRPEQQGVALCQVGADAAQERFGGGRIEVAEVRS